MENLQKKLKEYEDFINNNRNLKQNRTRIKKNQNEINEELTEKSVEKQSKLKAWKKRF